MRFIVSGASVWANELIAASVEEMSRFLTGWVGFWRC
jgi:hypothetical protein